MHELLPRLPSISPSRRQRDLARCLSPPVTRCGSRSASAASSTFSGRRGHNPDVGIIGCEPFEDGVVKAWAVDRGGKLANVRLACATMPGPLLRWLPDGSHCRVVHPLPRPVAEERHHKRRLVSALLTRLARVMKPGAELRFAHRHRRLRPHGCCWRVGASATFIWTAKRPARLARAPGRLAVDPL